jgi:hypothetical protein
MPSRPTTNSHPSTSTAASSRRSRFSGGGGISHGTHQNSVPKPKAPSAKPEASAQEAQSREPKALKPDTRSLSPLRDHRINSFVRNILLTNHLFPRFYADIVLHYSPNSNEARILRPHYQKICEKVNAIMSQNGTCTHIKVTRVRCGSPALKGEQFCYFHQNAIRSVRRPKQSRLHPIALIEDEESIQYALMEVINALMKNTIDLKRATLILRALHIAVKNASRVRFGFEGMNAVKQVPEYAPPPDNADFDETREIDLPYNAWVPPKSERQIMEEKARARKLEDWKAQQSQIRADLERTRIKPAPETAPAAASPEPSRRASASVRTDPLVRPAREANANVGADAFVRPGREATVPAAEAGKPAQASPETTLAPHNFKPQQSTPVPQQTASQKAATQRKPPQPSAASSTERKNATHARLERTRRTARHA